MASANNVISTEAVGDDKQGSCANCNRPDSYDNYVQCDRCNEWWHYLCAGVTDSVADRSFTCEACCHISVLSHESSSSSRIARMQLQLKEMEEKFKQAQEKLEYERKAFDEERKLLQQEREVPRQTNQRTADWVDAHAGSMTSADGQPGDRGAAAAINPHQQENVQNPVPSQPGSLSSAMQAAINTAVQAAVQAALQATRKPICPRQDEETNTQPHYTGAIRKATLKDLTSTRIGNPGLGKGLGIDKQIPPQPSVSQPTEKQIIFHPPVTRKNRYNRE